jgi:hypothetical protein
MYVHDADSVAAGIQSSELLNRIAGTCIFEYHAKFELNSGKYRDHTDVSLVVEMLASVSGSYITM